MLSFSVHIRNKLPGRELFVDIQSTGERSQLLSDQMVSIRLRSKPSNLPKIEFCADENQVEIVVSDSYFSEIADSRKLTSKPAFLLRNRSLAELHVYQEPCTFECWMPAGEALLFEEYCEPVIDPLVLEIRDDMILIESWLPPDEELLRVAGWRESRRL